MRRAFSIRQPTDDDWPAILEIANASVADVAGSPTQNEWLENRRRMAKEVAQNHFVVTERAGVIGYGAMEAAEAETMNGFRLFVVTHPSRLNDVGSAIYAELEALLERSGATLSWFIEYAEAEDLLAFIRVRGYTASRRFTLDAGQTAVVMTKTRAHAR